jgi:hypothetical protein
MALPASNQQAFGKPTDIIKQFPFAYGVDELALNNEIRLGEWSRLELGTISTGHASSIPCLDIHIHRFVPFNFTFSTA